MKLAIVDDESLYRQLLLTYTNEILTSMNVSCEIICFSSGEELLRSKTYIPILILDCEMETINGIETAKRYKQLHPYAIIIFVTMHEEYVYDGYTVRAFRYLTKPIQKEQLKEAIQSSLQLIEQKSITITKENRRFIVPKNKIIYVESGKHGNGVMICLATQNFADKRKMDDMETLLGTQNFYRTHKSYIVNFEHIREYSKQEITLTNGQKALISTRKWSSFLKAYDNYKWERGCF